MHERFHLLSYGLAIVLGFIGAKMLLVDLYKVPIAASLGVIAALLGLSVLASLLAPPQPARPLEPKPAVPQLDRAA
jgi:tellurite resistance protein TerC